MEAVDAAPPEPRDAAAHRLARARRVRARHRARRPGDARAAARRMTAPTARRCAPTPTPAASRSSPAAAPASAARPRSSWRGAARGGRSAGAGPEPLAATVRGDRGGAAARRSPSPPTCARPTPSSSVVDAALERFGALDVLVNNAGGQFSAPAEEIADKGWRAVERVTVDAVWEVTRTVATRAMIPARRRADRLRRVQPAARQPGLRPRGGRPRRRRQPRLRAGAGVEPPPDPHRLRGAGDDPHRGARRLRRRRDRGLGARVPLGRLGTPEEVGALIAFLATPGGAYVTGTTIVVDGGADAWGLGEPPPAVGS